MKAWGRLVVFACAAAALLALPGGASAKPDPEVHPGTFNLEIRLPESDGYRAELTASDHRQIYLTVERGSTAVRYRVAGRASSRRVKADFGPLGRVDIQMDLETRPLSWIERLLKVRGERCRGKEPTKLAGRFHGSVEFKGEENVVGVFARRGHAVVERTYRAVCEPRVNGEANANLPIDATLFAARRHAEGRTISFQTADIRIYSEHILGLISGGLHERLGRVRIRRSAFEVADGPALRLGPAERSSVSATVKPPSPFTGQASYLKRVGSRATWTGTLAVPLPGTGEVRLAGPGFDSMLCEVKGSDGLEKFDRCFLERQALSSQNSMAALLRDLYGSGSHSQPLALARLSSLR